MKKFLGILILVATFMTPASAQIKFGVKGGVNVTNMSFSKDVFNASNRAGFYIGPSVKFTLPIVGLGIDASAQYDQREAKVEDQAITAKSINIPINVRYTIGLGDLAGIYFAAGPQFGFNVGGIPEMIDHQVNGYVARYKDPEDLATGIHWVLEVSDYKQLNENAVHKVSIE